MTTLAHRFALQGRRGGGIAARRPLIRWAWRMFRREWRQQVLVIALLTVAVAAAIASVTVAYNSGSDTSNDAEFGSANTLLDFDGRNPRALQASLAAVKQEFGTIDVIGHRSLAVPGGVEKLDFRSQDPRGTYGGPRLALRRGNYPEGRGQVAVTDGVAQVLGLELGGTLAIDGNRRTVVGIVENPSDLSDEFALVSPSSAGAPDHVTVLVDNGAAGASPDARANLAEGVSSSQALQTWITRGNDLPAEALLMFSVATVFVLLASLIAAAGFAVIALRRLRQLGMLAAVGATEKHLRLVLLWNGAIVGAIGALIGTIVGLTLWLAIAPALEPALGHRLDRLSLPWTLLAMILLVAVVGATAAAWWPGRAVVRVPVTLALSARPPRPKPAHHSAIVAVVLIAAGVGSLVLSNRNTPPLIVAGILATILGTLLLGPLAIRLLARAAGHTPIAVRLALRDLTRYQARSGAALAAISLAIGIAATVVIIGRGRGEQVSGQTAQPFQPTDSRVHQSTGGSGFHRDPDARRARPPGCPRPPTRGTFRQTRPWSLSRPHIHRAKGPESSTASECNPSKLSYGRSTTLTTGEGGHSPALDRRAAISHESRLYVATPALLTYLGIDPPTVDSSIDFLVDSSVQTDELVTLRWQTTAGARSEPTATERDVTNVQKIDSRKLFGSTECGDRPASLLRHARRPSPSRLETDPVRLARRVEPTSDERRDLRRPRPRSQCRTDDRDPA